MERAVRVRLTAPVDGIVRRYEALTGTAAIHATAEKSFAELAEARRIAAADVEDGR